jgi:RNA polymerase sigma factor (sigma-70 family)
MAIYSRMKMPVECREWITCLQQGEEKALKHFFEALHDGIYDSALRIVQDRAEAKDIAQESFMKLWASREVIQDETHVRNFLYLEAKRLSLMSLRSRKKQILREGEFSYLSKAQDIADEPDPGMQAEMMAHDALDQLLTDIETLPPGCQEVFKLYYLEKMNTRQIAEHLGLCPQTVLNHKTRARNRLRQLSQRREVLTIFFFFLLWLNH